MSFNPETLAAVRATYGRERMFKVAFEEIPPNGRYLMIASEGIGKHVENTPGRIYETPEAACVDHSWELGVPEFLIDLMAEPEKAVIELAIVVTPIRNYGPGSLEDRGVSE